MKVLLIGNGGRESAIAYKIKQSKLLSELKVYPGNGGFLREEIIPKNTFNLKNKESVQKFVIQEKFEFVIVGPEEPLVDGITDWMDEISIPCFGPSKYCANLEGSKDFAKNLMKEFNVPTANYETFYDYENAIKYLQNKKLPIVIKADGLAAGKGVTVALDKTEAIHALESIFIERKFGSSGSKVVIEEFMEGEEASIFAICDGNNFLVLPAAQDHKRALDGDKGPNTGGMGAYAPAPIIKDEILEKVKEKIFKPMLNGLKIKGYPYKGLLYAGLMIFNNEPKVVEFNARFGDPETQALMLLLEDDLLQIMYESAKGKFTIDKLNIKKGFSTIVVLAASGYPGDYSKGMEINFKNPESNSTIIFHAGTQISEDKILSNGGRILGIASFAETLQQSVDLCYHYLKNNQVQNTFFRKDIAGRAL
jgi:phosphoribosylamine---glycine ligase